MKSTNNIFVAGASGMVGSAIIRALIKAGYTNIIGSYHSRNPDYSLLLPEGFDLISSDSDELLLTPHASRSSPLTPYALRLTKADLTNQQEVARLFNSVRPDHVFLAAAKVGGIMANTTYRAQFIHDNLQIQNNIIHQSYLSGVKKLMFLGSTCVYPRQCPQPMKEEYLLTSPLEYTNEPYAIAKIAGLKMCESYNIQYGTNYICVMPTNLYGPGDNFDLEKAHVLPALLRRMHLGKCLEQNDWESLRADLNTRPINSVDGTASEETILDVLSSNGISFSPHASRLTSHASRLTSHASRLTPHASRLTPHASRLTSHASRVTPHASRVTISIWGTGRPMREFLWSEDMADACVFIMKNVDFSHLAMEMKEVRNTHINIGSGQEVSIKELAEEIKDIVGFAGDLAFDSSRPDGTPRKLTDVSRLNGLGWRHKTSLSQGLNKFYKWYIKSQARTLPATK
jgi:GDP-L-fucose synthase